MEGDQETYIRVVKPLFLANIENVALNTKLIRRELVSDVSIL